jgi:hypothetical protein
MAKGNLEVFRIVTSRDAVRDCRPDRLWGPSSLLFNAYRVSFLGVKRPGRKVNHSHPSSVEIKKNWSYTYSPLYDFMARTGTILPLPLHKQSLQCILKPEALYYFANLLITYAKDMLLLSSVYPKEITDLSSVYSINGGSFFRYLCKLVATYRAIARNNSTYYDLFLDYLKIHFELPNFFFE